ncbi:hypothetical protein PC123_g24242 [Phytophthora cactorum]|nr:hypothetical protein PC123_g24242 [Phytophthora cactorum]
MHFDSLAGSPNTSHTTPPRRPVAAPQYFGQAAGLWHVNAGASAPVRSSARTRTCGSDSTAPRFATTHRGRAVPGKPNQNGSDVRYPDARQKKLAISQFDGKELYVGLGSGLLGWGCSFERQAWRDILQQTGRGQVETAIHVEVRRGEDIEGFKDQQYVYTGNEASKNEAQSDSSPSTEILVPADK